MEWITQYYGFDILGFCLLVIYFCLIGKKIRAGWLFGCAGAACFAMFSLMVNSWPSLALNIVACLFQFYNWVKWGRN